MRFSPVLNTVVKALILGPPGSGKATISSRLRKDFPIDYVSSGDLLRHHGSAAPGLYYQMIHYCLELREQISQLINTGQLVPDEIVVRMMFAEFEKFANTNLLVDGFPRTVSQAEMLEKSFPITCVFLLDVPYDEIINRVKDRWIHIPSGRIYNDVFNPPKRKGLDDLTGEVLVKREDDEPENVKRRLEKYDQETLPLLKFYGDRNLLHRFQGRHSNELWPQIHKTFSQYVKPLSYTDYGSH